MAAVALAFFCSGIAIFAAVPAGMTRSYNNYTTTIDGVNICYDVFEPKGDASTDKPAVILGHGVMVNKNFLRLIALDLAEHGFVVAALDFRGHGRSGGHLRDGFITDDIQAVKAELAARGDINMTNLGYLGYSMGGGAGFSLLDLDGDFNAMVSLAAGGRTQVTTPNLLILHGEWDEAFSAEGVYAYMENKTGVPADQVEIDRVYGSFEDGTALKLHITATDHLLAPYAKDNIVETRMWFIRALMYNEESPTEVGSYSLHLAGVFMALAGGFGLFLFVAGSAASAFASRPEIPAWEKAKTTMVKEEEKESGKAVEPPAPAAVQEKVVIPLKTVFARYWIWMGPLSLACIAFVAPFFLLPMYYMNLFVALLIGPSMAVMFYQVYLARKMKIRFRHVYGATFRGTSWKNVALGLACGICAYGVLGLSLNFIFGIVPAATKWGWSVLYMAAIFFLNQHFSLFFQGFVHERLAGSEGKKGLKTLGLSFAMRFVPITLLVLASVAFFGSWFNIQFLIPLAPLVVLMDLTSITLYRRSRDVLVATIANSIFLTLALITLAYI